MSPEVDNNNNNRSIVHYQMAAVATCRGGGGGGPPLSSGDDYTLGRMPSAKRRVFVQTENGSVLGIELDRSDNAQTLKRKLRLALNVPTDESLLVCGDMVLKNDLSIVRNDSPLLLTRNLMHRSSSTPCFAPIGRDFQQRDQSGPIEVLGYSAKFDRIKRLVVEIVHAIKNDVDPVPVNGGLGGAYYFRNCHGENLVIVKPTDEEPYAPNNPKGFVGKALGQPGLKRSVRVGETGFREVAAFLLDYNNFANVPDTALVKVTHSVFNVNDEVKGNAHRYGKQASKFASLQQFIPHDFDASDYGTSSFPVAAVHRIGILDIRILNTDRHGGNLLVRKLDGAGRFGQVELIPIDHGLCLPEGLEDPYFEWMHWPQASVPFSDDELEYISKLDPFRDADMLRIELPLFREASLRVLIICTIFLKEAAEFGLCLSEMGEMMSREFRGQEEEPSELELICIEAKKMYQDDSSNSDPKSGVDEEFFFGLDYDDDIDLSRGDEDKMICCRSNGENGKSSLSKVEETAEDDMEDDIKFNERSEARSPECTNLVESCALNVPQLTTSMKNISIGEKSWRPVGSTQKSSYGGTGTSSGNRSANEQLPTSSGFVKVADMSEEQWMQFLENYQRLLRPAFANRNAGNTGQRQRQRLGTSCRF